MKKTKNFQSSHEDQKNQKIKEYQGDKKSKVFQLWWFDKEEKRHFPAGVAFHEHNFGEYRLKIDIHPENQYYLKPILSTGDRTRYRVEVVIKKNGKFKTRKSVGEGHSNALTQGDVIMNIGPYSRSLIMGSPEGEQDE